jgi:hypothetical protein
VTHTVLEAEDESSIFTEGFNKFFYGGIHRIPWKFTERIIIEETIETNSGQ